MESRLIKKAVFFIVIRSKYFFCLINCTFVSLYICLNNSNSDNYQGHTINRFYLRAGFSIHPVAGSGI